jgi:cephalosporin hydroxylase
VQEWLPAHPEFAVDTEIEPFITFAPGGYLRRVH